MRTHAPLVLALGLPLTLHCEVDRERLIRPSSAPPPSLEASPPPASGPEEEALSELLFAGELGPEAAALGQRARMLVWLDAMALTPAQAEGLLGLQAALAARETELARAVEAAAGAEAAALTPIYREIVLLVAAAEAPAPELLEHFATELAAARAPSGRSRSRSSRSTRWSASTSAPATGRPRRGSSPTSTGSFRGAPR